MPYLENRPEWTDAIIGTEDEGNIKKRRKDKNLCHKFRAAMPFVIKKHRRKIVSVRAEPADQHEGQ